MTASSLARLLQELGCTQNEEGFWLSAPKQSVSISFVGDGYGVYIRSTLGRERFQINDEFLVITRSRAEGETTGYHTSASWHAIAWIVSVSRSDEG